MPSHAWNQGRAGTPPCYHLASLLSCKRSLCRLTAGLVDSDNGERPLQPTVARAGSVQSSGMYFAAANLAPLIYRVLSVSRMRVLLPVKANICDIILHSKHFVK